MYYAWINGSGIGNRLLRGVYIVNIIYVFIYIYICLLTLIFYYDIVLLKSRWVNHKNIIKIHDILEIHQPPTRICSSYKFILLGYDDRNN